VAVELTKRDGRQWAAFPGEGKRGFGVDIRSADGEIVNFQVARAVPPRVCIEGIDPLTAHLPGKPITVASSRGRDAIAREIASRLLPGYRAALTSLREREAAARARFDARASLVNAAERLFGEPTDFGEFDPAVTGMANYRTEARLALRGSRDRGDERHTPEAEFARVTVTDDGATAHLEMRGIPADVVLRMLAVLAEHNATFPES
jgi:hypothetical protein